MSKCLKGVAVPTVPQGSISVYTGLPPRVREKEKRNDNHGKKYPHNPLPTSTEAQ